jgi:hypothetical protein
MSRTLLCRVGRVVAVSIVVLWFAQNGFAEQKAPIKLAVQTTIGPSDAPVRTAIYTPADRQRMKVEPVWYGGRGFYGYRPYYYNRPYYSYYRAPYAGPSFSFSYSLPPPYYNYYPSPYYSYYTPPTYYSAAPYYPSPYYAYRVPRRAFVVPYGGYYW